MSDKKPNWIDKLTMTGPAFDKDWTQDPVVSTPLGMSEAQPTAGRVGTQGTTRMLTGEVDEQGVHMSESVPETPGEAQRGVAEFPPFHLEPGKIVSYPKDFTAEKDIYSRVYAAWEGTGCDAGWSDTKARVAVYDMMKFFNELQEKQ